MSLLEHVSAAVTDRAPGWLDDLTDRARTIADERLNGPERDLAKEALDKLAARSDALGHLGAGGLVAVLTALTVGDEERARLSYLAERATFAERREASHDATAATVRAAHDRAAYWREVKELAQGLGQVALRVIPLLLAAA